METSRHASAVADIGDKILIMVHGTFLIKPSVAEKEIGGLVIPNTKEMRVGTLVKAGPPIPSIPFPEIPVGSKIYYLQTNSLEINHNGEIFLVASWRDIRLAVEQ